MYQGCIAMSCAEVKKSLGVEIGNEEEEEKEESRKSWRMVELRAGAGMAAVALDPGPTSSKFHYTILTILDAVFSATVAAPAVVGYWRGTWGLSDIYVYPNDQVLSYMSSVLIGFTGLFIFNLVQHLLDEFLHPDKHRLSYYVFSRMYTSVFGFCCVNAWRGAWQALDIYTEQTTSTVFATTAVSLLALAIMRTIRNISAPPFSLSLDSPAGYFEVPTMFRVDNTRDWSLYILDCAFSVGVVGSLVVFVWRGVWVLFELHLFPENREYSAIGSLIIGYIIVAVTFCLQPLMRYTCAKLEGLARLLAADAFLLLSFLGTVNVWRGIWSILDLWLLPDDIELSCWITHVGCFVFLVLLNCSNSILVRGVYIDAEEEEGRCVVFPCHYLRLFFKVRKRITFSSVRRFYRTLEVNYHLIILVAWRLQNVDLGPEMVSVRSKPLGRRLTLIANSNGVMSRYMTTITLCLSLLLHHQTIVELPTRCKITM